MTHLALLGPESFFFKVIIVMKCFIRFNDGRLVLRGCIELQLYG
jgi:hypothetical protein